MTGGRRIVHGTPLTPNHLLESLAGGSFCVSFARPDQLARSMDLVGDDEILILDNGAFSIWQAQTNPDPKKQIPSRLQFEDAAAYREAFWAWANEAQAICPQAVAVIPDVIGGSEHENLVEISWALREGLAAYPERTMSIWHMDESLDQLATHLKLCNFVGMGSCDEYDVRLKRPAYLQRMKEVYQSVQAIDTLYGRRPWIHLMRGLGAFKDVAWADSADSVNVARNCNRLKASHGDQRAIERARRISEPIQSAAAAIPLRRAS